MGAGSAECPIHKLDVRVCKIPTDFPEQDGTFTWDSTSLVIVNAHAGGRSGTGFSYANEAAAVLIKKNLADVVTDCDAMVPTTASRPCLLPRSSLVAM